MRTVTLRRAALAGVALVALVAVVVHVVLPDDDGADALATERERRASGIQIAADERLLWGNLVVRAAGSEAVELTGVELLGASDRLRLRRALVADGSRPQSRLLVWGERAFERVPDIEAWRRSLKDLAGYRVEPVDGPWKRGFEGSVTRDGRWRDTEIVLEFKPIGRGVVQVEQGVRVRYRVGDDEGHIDLPNKLAACAPTPCRYPRPEGF